MKKIQEFILILLVGGFIYMIINNSNNSIPKIPLKDFFRNPEKASFQLSPDGSHIALMKPWKDGNRMMNIYIRKMDSNKEIRITNASDRSIYGYFWLNNNRIAYIQDKGGDENIHIYAVNIDGTNDMDLTPFENIQARIEDDLENDPDYMLVSLNKRDPRIHDVYRLNINDGALTLIAENPGNIMGWMTDNDGKLRIATTSDGVNTSLLYRDSE